MKKATWKMRERREKCVKKIAMGGEPKEVGVGKKESTWGKASTTSSASSGTGPPYVTKKRGSIAEGGQMR